MFSSCDPKTAGAGGRLRAAHAPVRRATVGIQRECLDRTLVLGRHHLEVVFAEYVERYNSHRPHLPPASAHRQVRLDSRPHRRPRRPAAPRNRRLAPPHPRVATRRELGGWVLGTHRFLARRPWTATAGLRARSCTWAPPQWDDSHQSASARPQSPAVAPLRGKRSAQARGEVDPTRPPEPARTRYLKTCT